MDPSDDNASRSSMLRRQRETALRRRSNQMPPPKSSDGNFEDGGRPSSSRRMSSATTTAMADVMAWEGAKKRERIDARIREEEIRKAEEARMRAEAEAEEEEEVVRRAEIEKFEKRQLHLQKQLALEQNAREKVARKLEDEKAEARKLAEAKAEAHRLEKERLEKERLEKERLEKDRLEKDKMADLERRLAEAEKARIEAERLAERACRLSAPFQTNGNNNPKCNSSSERAPHPDPKNGHHSANGTRTGHQRWPSSQMNQTGLTVPDEQDRQTMACNKEMYEQFTQDTTCSNSGYQRYLSTFHQPSSIDDGRCGGGAVSSEGDCPAGFAPVLHADRNRPTTAHSKIKRSVSTRSLTFTNIDATDQVEQPESSGKDAPQKEDSKFSSDNVQSLQHITSIESVNLDDPICLFSFLMKPCPKGLGMIQCCVRRNKGIKNVLFPEYRMYLKSSDRKSESFLMTSKKRVGNTTSNYLISMGRNDHDKNSDSILGKLRSNFLGTEYHIYDHGKNPDYEEAYYDEKNDGDIRCELGAILYAASTSLGSKGPRKMKVCISKVDEDDIPLKVWRPTKEDDESMVTCLKKEATSLDRLILLENKPPSWNNEAGAYVLNFNGRVTMASVKNFQLCTHDEQHIMQFGRTGNDEFSLDVQWPMSLLQAFAVSLSSFDSKLGCD